MTYNKEAVYNEQIAPLMTQILAITQREGIQMLASFALIDKDPNYHDEPMVCTSYTKGKGYNNPELDSARDTILAGNEHGA